MKPNNQKGFNTLGIRTFGLSTGIMLEKFAVTFSDKPQFIAALRLKIFLSPFSDKCSLRTINSTICFNNSKSEPFLVISGY